MMPPEYVNWLLSAPPSVRRLAGEFPPGTLLECPDNDMWYVIGYTENDMLIISRIDPSKDYDGANESKRYVCADHIRERMK